MKNLSLQAAIASWSDIEGAKEDGSKLRKFSMTAYRQQIEECHHDDWCCMPIF